MGTKRDTSPHQGAEFESCIGYTNDDNMQFASITSQVSVLGPTSLLRVRAGQEKEANYSS